MSPLNDELRKLLNPEAQACVAAAILSADRHRDTYVELEHLVCGLVSPDSNATVRELLEGYGLTDALVDDFLHRTRRTSALPQGHSPRLSRQVDCVISMAVAFVDGETEPIAPSALLYAIIVEWHGMNDSATPSVFKDLMREHHAYPGVLHEQLDRALEAAIGAVPLT